MNKKKSFFIFFGLLLASLVFFSFGTISKAYDYGGSSYDYYYANMVPDANYRLDIYSNLKFAMSKERTPAAGSGYYYPCVYYNDQIIEVYEYYYRFYTLNPAAGGVEIPGMVYNVVSGSNSNGKMHFLPGDMPLFDTDEEMLDYFTGSDIDFENLIYSYNIPVPELDVTYIPAISMLGGLPETNNVFTSINVQDNEAFKVQLAIKITVADMVQIGLNDGTITYKYLDWTDGTLTDIYSLEDQQEALDIYVSNDDLKPIWSDLYNLLYDDSNFPIFSSSVPFWNSNPNASKYLNAQSYYRNNMARQMPMYGTRLEVFARYFAIVDESVFVGAWRHWNSAEPLNTEKVTDKYQDQQPFPGTENTNTNVDYDNEDDTYTNIGTQTGVYTDPYTQVIINQNVPNYPDYPTAVSYNHDNILLQFIQTANQLPNFFGQFGQFLTATFSFIDSSVWAIIGFGFMCSIVVMIIKVL